jgi:uncharacterized protein YraI
MRRMLAVGFAIWLAIVSLLTLPSQRVIAQDGAMLGDAPYLADGMVVAASGDDIVQAAAVPAVDITSRAASAAFYYSYYTGQPAIGWTGSQSSCIPGTTSSAFKAAVIDRVAFYRAMAGVPSSVGLSETSSVSNQQAALMFSRNNQLSHTPPTTWACYTAAGAQAAGSSNIALGTYGVGAIDAYMKDAGSNNAAAGHRRWILFPQTQSFGTGDVPSGGGFNAANSLWVWDSNINGPRPATRDGYVAWPPPGYVPYQVVYPRWSFSYPGASFGGASVSVTLNGASVPVAIDSSTANGYGENTIVFRLNGMSHAGTWAIPSSDQTYTVRISGVSVGGQSRTFTYNVTIFDPATVDPGPATSTPTRTPTRTATSTGGTISPSPTATPTRTPTTVPGGYAIGERFILTTSVSLRSGPGTTFTRLAVVPSGTTGTVTGAPVSANGYTFYPVSIAGYPAGWMAGEFFARTTSPSPTPTRTLTTAAATATRTSTAPAATSTRTPTATRTSTAPAATATRTPTASRTATSPSQATATRVPGGFITGDRVSTTTSVNLRSGPSTGASVITVVATNTTGTITGAGVVSGPYTFYPITFSGIGSGWIAGNYLRLVSGAVPTATRTPTRTATTTSGFPVGTTVYPTANLNIRSGPGTGFAVVGVALRGTSATVTGASVLAGTVKWYPLQVPGIGAGWASGDYLSGTPVVQGPLVPTVKSTAISTETSTLEPTQEPTQTPTAVPPSETPLPTATATIVDVLTPTEASPSEPPADVPADEPTAEQPVSADAPEEPLWLPIARIQRSPDSQPGQVLVDGDPATVWTANGAGQPLAMFVLDFGQESAFSQVQWQSGEAGQSGTLYLSISSDNAAWTDLDPTLAYLTEDGWIVLDAPVSAQYVRFVFVNDVAADWLGGIAEVRIMP